MATPDEQLMLLEQQLGRTLSPAEIASLGPDLGFDPGAMAAPAPMSMAPAPAMSPAPGPAPGALPGPAGGLDEAAQARLAHERANAWRGHQPADPSVVPPALQTVPEWGEQAGGGMSDAGPLTHLGRDDALEGPSDEELLAIADEEMQPDGSSPGRSAPFPRVDLSVLGLGDQGAGRFGREAAAQREAVEAARGEKAESIRGVQDQIGRTRERLISSDVDREVAEGMLEEQFRPQRDAAQALVDERMRKYEDANRAADDVEIKDRRSFKTKIMSGLAEGFGAFAQAKMALAGGRMDNPAAGAVERSIQNDIEEQRLELANRRDSADAAKSELSEAYKRVGDIREAESIARTALREKYARTAEQIMGELEDTQQVAELEGVVQGLNEQNALEREQGALRNQALANQRAAQLRAEQRAAQQRTVQQIQDYEASQNMAGGLRVNDPQRFDSITGGDRSKTAEVTRDTIGQMERSESVLSIIDQMQELRQHVAARLIDDSAASSRLESLQNQLTARYSKLEQLGALDNGTVDLVNRVVGDTGSVSDLLTGSAGEKLDAYRSQLAADQDRFLRNRGLGFSPTTNMRRLRDATLQSRTRPATEEDLSGGGGR